ncbi:MAG: hypothetical protein O7I93_14425 [Gemmatimonadetes bacterium]|nr:hypothetical protein [Gemmatimonadota bacterium]
MVRWGAPSPLYLLHVALCLCVSCSRGFDEASVQERLLSREQELLRHPEAVGVGATATATFGSDPYRVHALFGGERYLALLRNASELLLMDDAFRVLARESTPRSPTGWAVARDRFVFVGGEQSASIQLYEIRDDVLSRRGVVVLEDGSSVRDLALIDESDQIVAVDDTGDRLIVIDLRDDWAAGGEGAELTLRQEGFALGRRPIQVRHVAGHLVINQLFDHSLLIVPLRGGAPAFDDATRIAHDGPFWAFDAVAGADSLYIVAAGIENRPLDRTGGEFGHVDSFLFLYVLARDGPGHRPLQPSDTLNLSALGVVTPKAVRIEQASEGESGRYRVWVAGYGSDRVAEVSLGSEGFTMSGAYPAPPGTSDFVVQRFDGLVTLVAANPLLDRVYRVTIPSAAGERSSWRSLYPSQPASTTRNSLSHLGEVLFFTTLLTPHNRSDGTLSRFTCEGCHFEGGIDGRVHHTGREEIHATTKTLRGMRNNVPLFSRGGDSSLASMVMAEFRAANQGPNDTVTISTTHYPWLDAIALPDTLTPEVQRQAFLRFLMDFRHRPNQRREAPMDSLARAGLAVFRDRCAHCHQPRVSTREGAPAVAFDAWRGRLESDGEDLVWGAPFFTKTGIEPYVRPAGARVPSLRRVTEKYPYFTNGSASTLLHVLNRFRYRGLEAWHAHDVARGGADADSLSGTEIERLLAALKWF